MAKWRIGILEMFIFNLIVRIKLHLQLDLELMYHSAHIFQCNYKENNVLCLAVFIQIKSR
jgi:hypothetical protein